MPTTVQNKVIPFKQEPYTPAEYQDNNYNYYSPQPVLMPDTFEPQYAQKKSSVNSWQKAGTIGTVLLGAAFMGMFIMQLFDRKNVKKSMAMAEKQAQMAEKQMEMQLKQFAKEFPDEEGVADKLKKAIKDVTDEKSFEELFLNDEMKKVIQELKTSIERADWLKKKGKKGGSGIMLYGEPGGGKNALVYAITKYLNTIFPDSKLIMMDVLKFKDKYNGGTENNIIDFVEAVVKEAKSNPKKKFIVFLDEFDSIARKDTSSNASMTESFQNAFKTKLLELTGVDNIQVIAATNKAAKDKPLNELLDEAIMNRFPTCIHVALPSPKQLLEAFVGHYKGLSPELVAKELTDSNNKELIKLCEYIAKPEHHASFRDYNNILDKARLISEAPERQAGSQITMADFKEAIRAYAESKNWNIKKTNETNIINLPIDEPAKESFISKIKDKAKNCFNKFKSFFTKSNKTE